jgi:hypothetical protein
MTGQTTKKRQESKFWKVALITLAVLTPITILSDILESKGDDTLMAIFMLPLMPGFIIYIIVTGDIHGWQPGPIGQGGRIIVTILGAWIFWTPIIYWIYNKVKRRKVA